MKVLIVGAGPVGATFALLAKRAGIDVALLEAREGPSRESRTLALSWGSREILDEAGIWGDALQATAIHSIHTSQKGGFGRVDLSREDGGVDALGYVLNYAQLQAALDEQLAHCDIAVTRGAAVSAIDQSGTQAEVSFLSPLGEQRIAADVVVLADGGANLGKVPAIEIAEKDYEQVALLAHIVSDSAHRHRAFERFTSDGPAALLPKAGACEYSMVWVAAPARIEALKAMEAAAFCAAFQEHFGYRAGKFLHVENRRSYPLKLRTVSAPVAGRVVVIGNAAQALHPVAGQGFNLGLRDALDLARDLAGGGALPDEMLLQRYAATRAKDVSRSVGFTDFLVGAFSRDDLLLRAPRSLGLAMVDLLPFARRALARRMLFGAVR